MSVASAAHTQSLKMRKFANLHIFYHPLQIQSMQAHIAEQRLQIFTLSIKHHSFFLFVVFSFFYFISFGFHSSLSTARKCVQFCTFLSLSLALPISECSSLNFRYCFSVSRSSFTLFAFSTFCPILIHFICFALVFRIHYQLLWFHFEQLQSLSPIPKT